MKRKLLTVTLLLVSISFFGQPGPPGPPSGPPCWPPPCIPIDGGISIFTLIAAFFGYKFYKKSTN